MNKVLIQGQTCNFLSESYISNKHIRGGMLEEPVRLELGNYILTFKSLYICNDTGKVYGGVFSNENHLQIGPNIVPAFSAFFYSDSFDIEFVALASPATVRVGANHYIFETTYKKDELYFHPNGEVMRGDLKEPVPIQVQNTKIIALTLGFWENNHISGIIPMYNTCYQGYEFTGGYGVNNHCQYTINFSPTGELELQ